MTSMFWLVSLLTAQAPPVGGVPPGRWEAGVLFPGAPWFGPVTIQPAVNMTIWKAAVRPPPGSSRLAVTLVFDESQGGFGRLLWQGASRSVTLCGNLYEGAAPQMQRTLLVDRETLGGPGTLVVETTGTGSAVLKAELAWVEPLVLAATGWTPPGLYLTPSGKVFPEDELRGEGRRTASDQERGNVADAVVDAGPVRVDPARPVRFLLPVAKAPGFARLEADAAGLLPGEVPALAVNGRPLGGVSVELPGLEDPGYLANPRAGTVGYGGWRKVRAWISPGLLWAGENQIDWQSVPGGSAHTLRNVRLQLEYGSPVASPGISPPAPPPVPRAVSRTDRPTLKLGLSSGGRSVGLRPE